MYDIFIYIIKWAISLALLYAPFALLMRKETFSSFNRAVLLCTMLSSMLLPFIKVEIPIEVDKYIQESVIGVHNNGMLATENSNTETTGKRIAVWQIIFIIYLIGVIILYTRTLINIINIRYAIHRGTLWHEKCERYTLHCHAGKVTPFSWFNNIVISQEDYDNCKDIILHEEGHIKGKHSWDILFTSILSPLQWFNPFIYMLINDLKDIHEYEADRYVLQRNNDAQAYQLLILRKAIGDKRYSLVNNFGRNSVRRRVEMMIRKRSDNVKLLKGLYLIPSAIATIVLFAKPLYIYSNEYKKKSATITDVRQEERKDSIKSESSLQATTKEIKTKGTEKNITKEKNSKVTVTNYKEAPTEPIAMAIAETEATEVKTATQDKKVIYKNYPKNIIIDNVPTETSCDNYKCAVIMQFDINNEGTINNYTAKGCNVSIEGYRGNDKIGTIRELRDYAIATATKFIGENSYLFASKEDEDILTQYTAKLILGSKKEESSIGHEILWIGTTPLK